VARATLATLQCKSENGVREFGAVFDQELAAGRVPDVVRACLGALGTQLLSLKKQILELDRMIMAWYRSNETSRRLHYIPGVGPSLVETALVARHLATVRYFHCFGRYRSHSGHSVVPMRREEIGAFSETDGSDAWKTKAIHPLMTKTTPNRIRHPLCR
jgi:hypothetical protein